MTTKPKKTIKALDSEATVLRKQVGALEELVAELQQRLDEVEKRLKSAEAAPRTFAEVVASKRPVSTVLLKPERGHRVLIKVGDNNKLSDQTIKDRPREESLSILKFRLGSEAVRQVRRLPDGNVAASLRDDVEDGEAWLQPTFGDHARITNGGTPVIIKGIPHDIIDEFTVDRLRKAGVPCFGATAKKGRGATGTVVCRLTSMERAATLTKDGLSWGTRKLLCEPFCGYIRIPQCYKCWSWGHKATHCWKRPVCGTCGRQSHKGKCRMPRPSCKLCKGQHSPRDWALCPSAKDILAGQAKNYFQRPRRYEVLEASPSIPSSGEAPELTTSPPTDSGDRDGK